MLLGIDIGTSGCKIALFSTTGELVCDETVTYPVHYPMPGHVEQDPEDWWQAVCLGTKTLIEKNGIDPKNIMSVGVDGQGWAAIALDSTGKVLTRNPIWMDTRAHDICADLTKKIGEKAIFDLAGNALKPQYTTGKILWYKENLPEVYKKTDKILQSNSYIVFRMTGAMTHDQSQGYAVHCFDMKNGCWDKSMAKALGIEIGMLPDLIACHEIVGTVSGSAAKQLGLVSGTPVVAGGLDAACGTLGAGVIHQGETQEQGGQAGGMSICTETYHAHPDLILGFHVVPNKWLLQGGTTGGGGVMRWFDAQFGYEEHQRAKEADSSPLKLMDEAIEKVPAGSEGLVFLPYMAGERSPIWNDKAKGVYYGLDFSKTKAHMGRAALEGVAYALKHNLEVAASAGAHVATLRATGGAANSRVWTQIKADVTGKPIEVPGSGMETPLGAAILAGVGVGVYKDFDDAIKRIIRVEKTYIPNAENKGIYEKGYKMYRALYETLKQMMQ